MRLAPLLGALIFMSLHLSGAENCDCTHFPIKPPPCVQICGKTLYTQYCSVCHGSDGKGNGPAANVLKTKPPDLTQLSHRAGGKFPDAYALRMVTGQDVVAAHGSRDTPIWGKVFNAEKSSNLSGPIGPTGAIVRYVEGIQSK